MVFIEVLLFCIDVYGTLQKVLVLDLCFVQIYLPMF